MNKNRANSQIALLLKDAFHRTQQSNQIQINKSKILIYFCKLCKYEFSVKYIPVLLFMKTVKTSNSLV
jgi:hypothetical protein